MSKRRKEKLAVPLFPKALDEASKCAVITTATFQPLAAADRIGTGTVALIEGQHRENSDGGSKLKSIIVPKGGRADTSANSGNYAIQQGK